jgi:hypothetical protein
MTDPLAPLRALPRLRLAPIANILDNPPLQVRFWHDLAVQTGLNERQVSTHVIRKWAYRLRLMNVQYPEVGTSS